MGQQTTSTCTLCPVGCSMILDSRDGEIMRTRSCENQAVNDIWLCDKGWFGYEFSTIPTDSNNRSSVAHGTLQPATWDEALTFVSRKIQQGKNDRRFGGNTLTAEENLSAARSHAQR